MWAKGHIAVTTTMVGKDGVPFTTKHHTNSDDNSSTCIVHVPPITLYHDSTMTTHTTHTWPQAFWRREICFCSYEHARTTWTSPCQGNASVSRPWASGPCGPTPSSPLWTETSSCGHVSVNGTSCGCDPYSCFVCKYETFRYWMCWQYGAPKMKLKATLKRYCGLPQPSSTSTTQKNVQTFSVVGILTSSDCFYPFAYA